jgi:hypothetical protein
MRRAGLRISCNELLEIAHAVLLSLSLYKTTANISTVSDTCELCYVQAQWPVAVAERSKA